MAYEFELQIANYIILIGIAIWYKLGGHPEGTYRIFGIRHFAQVLFLEDGTPKRKVYHWNKMITASPSHFINKDGLFYIDRDNTAKTRGCPTWYHHKGKALPIPIFTGQFKTPGYNLDPLTIKRAYKTDIDRRLRSISKSRVSFGWMWYALAGLVVLGLIYYFFV